MNKRILGAGSACLVLVAMVRPAAAADAGTDAAADAGDDGGDGGLVCPTPAVETGFTPAAYVHAVPHQNACSQQLIDDYYTLCLASTATAQSCAPFTNNPDAAHQACAACIVTPSTASAYGPVIQATYGNFIVSTPNLGGCIEILDPSGLACATKLQDRDDCDNAACDTQCPIVDSASFAQWQTCLTNADDAATSCQSFFQATSCVDSEEPDGGVAAACFTTVANPQFGDDYAAIAPVFCLDLGAADGGGGSDGASGGDGGGGADAAGDAVTGGDSAGAGDATFGGDATTGGDAAAGDDGGPVTTRPEGGTSDDGGPGSSSSKSGCGCRAAPATDAPFAVLALLGLGLLARRRRGE
jgi:MYXO-CTERM domain-containing protein